MIHEIPLPDLDWGDGVEITLAAWLKRPGDRIDAGEVVAEVLSEKANVEIESPVAGVLAEALVEEGATVAVGQPIARITTEDR
jgi:pyruvate/2-oxoglutarate dehydrogenase complex dihydrolipoamide acyltransferase (E2) component